MPMYPWIYWPKLYMHFLFPACMPHVPSILSSMSTSKHHHDVYGSMTMNVGWKSGLWHVHQLS